MDLQGPAEKWVLLQNYNDLYGHAIYILKGLNMLCVATKLPEIMLLKFSASIIDYLKNCCS